MKKSTVKRAAALLLLLSLLAVLCPGCGEDDFPPEIDSSQTESSPEPMPTLTLWIDIPDLWGQNFNSGRLLESVPGQNQEFMVLADTLTNQEPDRSNKLTNMRVEMMAGKGPDIFLCSTGGGGGNFFLNYDADADTFTALGRTFPFLEQAMKNRIFLPLDELIENQSNRMEWDKLEPVIMAAGRNEEGQQLLPMGYSFYVFLYDRADYTLAHTLPMTYQEMLDSDDPMLILAGLGNSLWRTLSQPVDYDQDTLNFTEEEFMENVRRRLGRGGFFETFENPFEEGTYASSWLGDYSFEQNTNGVGDDDPEYWMVPCYNDAGGITAEVSAYTAINRNTQYPEYAFRVVDTLLSEQVQRDSGLYQMGVAGMPVYRELGTREKPFIRSNGSSSGPYYMNDWNREQFEALREQINGVYLATALEEEETMMFQEMRHAGWTDESIEKAAKKAYSTMKMMIAES